MKALEPWKGGGRGLGRYEVKLGGRGDCLAKKWKTLKIKNAEMSAQKSGGRKNPHQENAPQKSGGQKNPHQENAPQKSGDQKNPHHKSGGGAQKSVKWENIFWAK
jgi:hypothetical protein